MNIKKNVLVGIVLGNLLEQYDMIIFGLMAVYISQTFFPPVVKTEQLSYTFFIFFLGYLMRPLGGIALGFLADVFGRKKALVWSVILMGWSTFIIGFLPSYDLIGSAALLLLVFCRLFQAFSIGAEYTNSVTFLFEHAPETRQGFFSAFSALGIDLGILVASIISTLITYLISKGIWPAWTWRVAFSLAIPFAWLSYWIRTKTPETMPFIRENATSHKISFKQYVGSLYFFIQSHQQKTFLTLALAALGTTLTYLVFLYSPLHVNAYHTQNLWKSLAINSISLIVVTLLIPLFGWLSDKVGRIICLWTAMVLILLLVFPFFLATNKGDLSYFLTLQLLMAIPTALFHSVAPTVIVSLFPVKVRCSTSSLLYGISCAVFGISAPFIVTVLSKILGNLIAPIFYLTLVTLVTFILLSNNVFFVNKRPSLKLIS